VKNKIYPALVVVVVDVVVDPFVVVVVAFVVVVVVAVDDPPHKLTPFSERDVTLGTGVLGVKVIWKPRVKIVPAAWF
jgi:hypothetical protein